MMVQTPYGPTNTNGGEILDLSPLRYKPRGRVKRPVKRYNSTHILIHKDWIWATLLILVVLALT